MHQNFELALNIYVIPPILGFFILISLAVISLVRGKRNPTTILFAGLCFIGAVVNANVALVSIIINKVIALKIDRALYVFIVFSVPLLIQFTHSITGITGRKWLEYSGYAFSIALLFFTPTKYFISGLHYYHFGTIAKSGPIFYVFAAAIGFAVFYSILELFGAINKAKDNQQINRIKYILGGVGMGAFLIALNILTVCGFNIYPMGNFSFIPAIFLAFGLLKYDLLDIGAVIRRGTIYFILTAILTVIYIVIIYAFNVLFVDAGFGRSFLFPLVLAVLIVLLFNPLKERIQSVIDDLFFRGKYDYHQLLMEISGKLASLLNFEQIKNTLLVSIYDALQVTHVCLFIYDDQRRIFRKYTTAGRNLFEEDHDSLDRDHPIMRLLETEKKPLIKSVVERKIEKDAETTLSFAAFGNAEAALFVPMTSESGLMGVIALGQKKSGELFVPEDLELLMTIANQSVSAIGNAMAYEEIERLNRNLERKVEERTAELREALEEKERTQAQLIQSESLAAIGQLVAGTAHELNNPLASSSSFIQTCISTIDEWEIKNDQKGEVIADLLFSLKELKRASDIVRSLLDLSRHSQVYAEPVDVNMALEDSLIVLHNQYKHLNIEIEKFYDKDLPLVEGNFANLGQVFINIIKNAIESITDGVGKVTLITTYIPETDRVVIEIMDTGSGIPHKHLQDIFKPFFTTKPVGKGTGLGLYISHEIIRRHGGSIKVRNVKDNGAVFSIELPCKMNDRTKIP